MIQQQNDWLSKELEIKSNQVLELKKERSAILTDKEMLVSSKDQEVCHVAFKPHPLFIEPLPLLNNF